MDRVRDNLFFGDIYDAADHEYYRENEIDAVVKLCGINPVPEYPDHVEVVDMRMPDSEENELEEVAKAVDLIVKKLERGQTVFVHCAAGQSRSVTVAAAVHAILEKTGFDQGLDRIRELRDVQPHPKLQENGVSIVQVFNGETDS
ncbi:dual specificity protein phosphatase family protein [Halorarum halobium]|uniref:dual specificity protein phosphatase family protein n=1 Tax=Halorarum halobium TaxID=3075121 RepID=UPI0028AE9B15|nr:dual specificity protein phosphatase [Halobaculum sp. XH14]